MSESRGRAIVSRGPNKEGKWNIEDVTVRPIRDDELLVQMVASGICHTDSYFADAPPAEPFMVFPRVAGHEGSGYVKQVGSKVTVAKPGDPVLLSFDCCTSCALCKGGPPSYCVDFNPLNFRGEEVFESGGEKVFGRFFGQSSFASLSVVSERSVVNARGLVRSDEELRLFAPLGCGVQTGSGTVVNVAQAGPGDSVAVIGLGGVGLSAVMAAKLSGVGTIVGIDRVPERIALAKELGATHGIDTSGLGDDLAALVPMVQECTPHKLGTTVTIETSGVAALAETGVNFTAPRGKVIQVGTGGMDQVKIPMLPFMSAGKTYMGAIEGNAVPSKYIPEMIQWYRDGKFPLEKLVRFYKAEDFKKGLEDMHKGADAVKPVILW